MRRFLLWLLLKLSKGRRKTIILDLLDSILNEKGVAIDSYTAEKIITMVVKSSGNKIIRFVIKD